MTWYFPCSAIVHPRERLSKTFVTSRQDPSEDSLTCTSNAREACPCSHCTISSPPSSVLGSRISSHAGSPSSADAQHACDQCSLDRSSMPSTSGATVYPPKQPDGTTTVPAGKPFRGESSVTLIDSGVACGLRYFGSGLGVIL